MELLLKSGADVKSLDERGDTPLHAAVRVDSEAIVVVRLQFFYLKKRLFIRCGGYLFSALDSGLSGPSSSSGRGHFVVFLGQTFYSGNVSLHPSV